MTQFIRDGLAKDQNWTRYERLAFATYSSDTLLKELLEEAILDGLQYFSKFATALLVFFFVKIFSSLHRALKSFTPPGEFRVQHTIMFCSTK